MAHRPRGPTQGGHRFRYTGSLRDQYLRTAAFLAKHIEVFPSLFHRTAAHGSTAAACAIEPQLMSTSYSKTDRKRIPSGDSGGA